MVTLPTPTIYWRVKGGDSDSWILDDDNTFTPTAGQTVEVVTVGPSPIAQIVADTTPTITGLEDLSSFYGDSVFINVSLKTSGTNLIYSLSGPEWLTIDSNTGYITGTAPSMDVSTTVTVTISNSIGSASDQFIVSVTPSVVGDIWQPIVLVGASNIAGGSPSGTLDQNLDTGDQLLIMSPSSGVVGPIDISVGIPRPGGTSMVSTTPGISFAKSWAMEESAPNVKYVIIPTAVGGRGIMSGGYVPDQGPWDADGTGLPWVIGGSADSTKGWGSLYKAQTNFKAALVSAAAAAGATLRGPVFVGHPLNENDANGNFATLRDKVVRCMTGIRAQWGAPDAPWVLSSAPPEWSYAGPLGRTKILAINKELQTRLSHVSWVDGVVGFQSTEDIHFNNNGLRAQGMALYSALATAQARSNPMLEVIDSIDFIDNKPQRAYGFYRMRSAYTGPVATISNGTTIADIYPDINGYPDYSAILSIAGNGNAWVTTMYDQMGSGGTMVPEGSGVAQIAMGGQLVLQGLRLGWGNDTTSNMLKDISYTVRPAGALFAVGRIGDAGSPIMAAGVSGSQAIFRSSGVSGFSSAGVSRNLDINLEWEPNWVKAIGSSAKGKTLHACMSSNGSHYADGYITAATTATAFTYTSVGLAWGGRIGATNRFHVGTQVALMAFDIAPTGSDLTKLLTLQKIWVGGDVNSIENASFDNYTYSFDNTVKTFDLGV